MHQHQDALFLCGKRTTVQGMQVIFCIFLHICIFQYVEIPGDTSWYLGGWPAVLSFNLLPNVLNDTSSQTKKSSAICTGISKLITGRVSWWITRSALVPLVEVATHSYCTFKPGHATEPVYLAHFCVFCIICEFDIFCDTAAQRTPTTLAAQPATTYPHHFRKSGDTQPLISS
jgi:hypothetical protein